MPQGSKLALTCPGHFAQLLGVGQAGAPAPDEGGSAGHEQPTDHGQGGLEEGGAVPSGGPAPRPVDAAPGAKEARGRVMRRGLCRLLADAAINVSVCCLLG